MMNYVTGHGLTHSNAQGLSLVTMISSGFKFNFRFQENLAEVSEAKEADIKQQCEKNDNRIR